MNSKSLSGTYRRGSYFPLGASTLSLSKRVLSAMESTFDGARCSSNRACLSVEIVAVVEVVSLLVGRAPVSTMFCPLEAALKHILAPEMSLWMVATRALLV